MAVAVLVDVLKQLLARKVATVLNDLGQAPVVDVGLVLYAALAAKADMDPATLDHDMAVAQSRQSVALVFFGIFGVADPKQGQLHEPHDSGEHALARQTVPLQILLHPGAD